jgi:chromosomal replication initiator protein
MDAIQHTALVAVNDHARHDDDDLIERVHAYLLSRRAHTADIKAAIAQFYCLASAELTSRQRMREISHARQVFCYLAYRYTRLSLAAVGNKVGLTDHTTVWFAVRKIEKYIVSRPLFADDIDLLRLKILELTVARKRGQQCH